MEPKYVGIMGIAHRKDHAINNVSMSLPCTIHLKIMVQYFVDLSCLYLCIAVTGSQCPKQAEILLNHSLLFVLIRNSH